LELTIVGHVGFAGQGAPHRKAAITEKEERDTVHDRLFGRVFIVRSGVDNHFLRFGVTLPRLAEGAGKIRGSRCGEILALNDNGVGTVI
jgi:hypothetical protein